ncbi:hypothetical protein [Microvirga terricola]|uniref:ABC transporter permease n=1 Tax=Microvirga terricola TaxID=2719797 RepID=A0ABX0V943_9HYPH|nr:hypothetical protein [Microvirga terricola]NIX76243.1 hypothetical protein [Microvirga terricola]
MPEPSSRTVLTDIDIPFGSLVLFFVKAALAAIPATFIVALILAFIGWIFRLLFGFGHMGGMMT